MKHLFFAFACLILAGCFLFAENKKSYLLAVILKGSASLMFVLLGILGASAVKNTDCGVIICGLILGLIADVLLNLRYVFEKKGKLIFLIGILVFLIGHIMYLIWAAGIGKLLIPAILVCAVLTFFLMKWIFTRITAEKQFKIFGVVYIGAVVLLNVVSLFNMFTAFSQRTVMFFFGSLLFLLSDIVLILNTFGKEQKFKFRILNISLYYLGQILIALSLQLI
ncbi:MAG: hypothetical protein IKM87_09660 [Clostridia bacterium]|nr:hypothetical protein [Clostridia bacterium]